jgi:hypothetical protein
MLGCASSVRVTPTSPGLETEGSLVQGSEEFGSKVKLASQSATGSFSGDYSQSFWGNSTGHKWGQLSFQMDVDTGNVRIDLEATEKTDEPALFNKDKRVIAVKQRNTSVLLSSTLKKIYYVSSKANIEGPGQGRREGPTCKYLDLPNLPEPHQYVACAENLLARSRKWLKKDVYVVSSKVVEMMGPMSSDMETAYTLTIGEDGAITEGKLNNRIHVARVRIADMGFEWKPSESSYGIWGPSGNPDASVFSIPAEWGECTEGATASDLTELSKTAHKWLKCAMPDI